MNILQHVLYINLDYRTDRLFEVQQELNVKLDIQKYASSCHRFPAIKHDVGAIGCALSHIRCLEIAYEQKYPYVFICEDDILFLNPQDFLNGVHQFEQSPPPDWNVFIVSGNSLPPYKQFNETCIQVVNCQTTTGYITHYNYYQTLIRNFKNGVAQLLKNPGQERLFAIDQYWKQLQQSGTWYMLYPPSVIQRVSYSDIEKKIVDYSGLMLDLEKKYIFDQLKKKKLEFLK